MEIEGQGTDGRRPGGDDRAGTVHGGSGHPGARTMETSPVGQVRSRGSSPARSDPSGQSTEILEDLFVLELKLTGDIFGGSTEARRAWAMQNLASASQAEHYILAWRCGKRDAWSRLQLIADDLRRASGDDSSQWTLRLARLQDRASQDVGDVQPTLSGALHPLPASGD